MGVVVVLVNRWCSEVLLLWVGLQWVVVPGCIATAAAADADADATTNTNTSTHNVDVEWVHRRWVWRRPQTTCALILQWWRWWRSMVSEHVCSTKRTATLS